MKKLFDVDRISENPRSNIIWRKEQINYIIIAYTRGESLKKIADDFNVHRNSIKKVLEDNNITIRSLQESVKNDKINNSIFNIIDTEEKAYWLGFLSADGNVYQTRISCSLQYEDREHLNKFNSFLGNPVTLTYFMQKRNEKTFKYCSLIFHSTEIARDLQKYGVVSNKSLILKPPYFLSDKKLQYAWIRGYFDGDGGISITTNPRRAQIYCTGTLEVLQWIIKILDLDTTPFLEHNCENTYRFHRNGWNICLNKLSLLYQNASIYLNRKYNSYLKLKVPTDLELRREAFYNEAILWAEENKQLILNCKTNDIYNTLIELFEIGKKYNFTDRRSVSNAICKDQKTKVMLQHLQSLLQQ